MPPKNDAFEAFFQRQIEELRLKIDSLPSEKRPHLWSLLEATERQHAEMRDSCTQIREMLDGLLDLEGRLRGCQEAFARLS